jgi:para-aminobenzoate synthetase
MTGAPKRRTCDIINQLESGYRGIYSGIMGFASYPQSTWNVVIRTMVYDHTTRSNSLS